MSPRKRSIFGRIWLSSLRNFICHPPSALRSSHLKFHFRVFNSSKSDAIWTTQQHEKCHDLSVNSHLCTGSSWFIIYKFPIQAHISVFSVHGPWRGNFQTAKLTTIIFQAPEKFPLGKNDILVTAVNESHKEKLAFLLMKFSRARSVVIKQTLPLHFHWRIGDVQFFSDQ